MEVITMLVFLFFSIFTLQFQLSLSTTVVVDGVSEWRNPNVHLGDSIIFKHKYHYKLYIFQNKRAFDLCNFTQSTLLSKPDSTSFTWHPSRPGFFYYTFNNGSLTTCHGQKLAIKVSLSTTSPQPQPQPPRSALSPEISPISAPPPSSGGSVSSSPAFPWPFRPRESASPSPAPISAILPATSPSIVGDKGGDDIPFINSNPAVPLPTGEVDSATIRPLATSGHAGLVVGLLAVQTVLSWLVSLMLL